MTGDTILSILTWIGLAFAAGLIGYFGKYFGKIIIARFSKKKREKETAAVGEHSLEESQKKAAVVSPEKPSQEDKITSYENKKAKADYKLEKKRLKSEQKKLKKLQKK